MNKEKSCGAIVYRKQNDVIQFLLIHQTLGHWTFPKGHMEKGESEQETAFREVQEETGISVRMMDGFREINTYSPKPDTLKAVVFFLATPNAGIEKPQLSEVSEMCWMTCVEAAAVITYSSDRFLLKKAIEYMKYKGIWKEDTE